MESSELINCRTTKGEDGPDLSTIRPWSDLPPELLSIVADRLGLIALFAFRGTCKAWRSAASEASASCECEPRTDPSVIICDERNKKCFFYYRSCSLSQWIYKMKMIPELDNANCLASDQGWLLIHKEGSLFFFCPFSRARIDLPLCQESDLSGHIAAFSAPPTSPECIVVLANLGSQDGPVPVKKLHLQVIRRVESEWTKHEIRYIGSMRVITAAVYAEKNGSFYFMSDTEMVMRFSVVEKDWTSYTMVQRDESSRDAAELLPFLYDKDMFSGYSIRDLMALDRGASISVSSTVYNGEDFRICVGSEKFEAPSGTADAPKLKGIWIQPRFIQIPENQGWNL